MRALLDASGPDPSTDEGLHERYRPPRTTWCRANFISAADGAATLAGTSGQLGGEADRRVFAVLRDHADVVLVGAGTVRAEGYGPPEVDAAHRARRRADGRAEVPRLAGVGRPAKLSGAERWITAAESPPLLVTSTRDARPVAGCETLVCGAESVDVGLALDALTAKGLSSVLCEGGPTLFADLAGSGRLDELCLTYSPVLAGPGAGRIVAGDTWGGVRPATLVGLLEDSSLLMCRYALR
jgi:riboflavin biosynthesis pyrimidine reductase